MEKKWTDQELQQLYEQDPQVFAELAKTNEDARLYTLLFTTLSSLETSPSSVEISHLVLAKLENEEVKNRQWQSIGAAIGIFCAVIGGIVLSFLLVPELVTSISQTYLYLPFLLTGILLFILIEYLDQKVIWKNLNNQLFK